MLTRSSLASFGLVTFLSVSSLVACGGDDGGSTNNDGGGNAAGDTGTGGDDGSGGDAAGGSGAGGATGGSGAGGSGGATGGQGTGGQGTGGAADNDCASASACAHGTCVEEPGVDSYSCDCEPGYEGATCGVDTDECAANPCKNGGTCEQGDPGKFVCTCPDGYAGPTCEWTEQCSAVPYGGMLDVSCPDGQVILGITSSDIGTPTGSCQDGFTAGACTFPYLADWFRQICVGQTDCVFPADLGPDDPCPGIDKIAYLEAACGTPKCGDGVQWQGEECDDGNAIDGDGCNSDCSMDNCVDNQCQNDGICIDGYGGYMCQCPAGFGGQFCEIGADICVNEPDGKWVSLYCPPGMFIASIEYASYGQPAGSCDEGFTTTATCHAESSVNVATACLGADKCQFPVDAAVFGTDPCPGQPKSLALEAKCAYPECGDGVLTANEECDDGNKADGDACPSDCKVDNCAGNPCQNGGTCNDGFGGYSCDCPQNTQGQNCEILDTNACDLNPCPGKQLCENLGFGNFACKCPEGTTGENCDILGDCDAVSEGKVLHLDCGSGVITSIDFASYGTPTGSCGSFKVDPMCDAASSKAVLEAACLGKATCDIAADNYTFVDPCEGTQKWMSAQVSCGQPG